MTPEEQETASLAEQETQQPEQETQRAELERQRADAAELKLANLKRLLLDRGIDMNSSKQAL